MIGVRIIADSIQTHETDEGVADLAKYDLNILKQELSQ